MSVVERLDLQQETGSGARAPVGRDGLRREATADRPLPSLPRSGNEPFAPFAASARANRWSIVTTIAAMVVISFAILYESKSARQPGPSEASHQADHKPAEQAPSMAREATSDDATRVVRASPPRIVDIVSDQPLVGDGRERGLFLSLDAARDDVESVESRFVEGDAALRARASVIDVSHPVPKQAWNEARLPAGMIGLKTTRPVRATFEFVVTLVDGRRSKPFRKELNIAPMPGAAPMATDVPAFQRQPAARTRMTANASCTRSTCGSVVLVREVGGESSTSGARLGTTAMPRRYEVLVRTDDRAIHAFREPRLIRPGTRARVIEGRLLALNAPTTTRPPRRQDRLVADSEPFVSW